MAVICAAGLGVLAIVTAPIWIAASIAFMSAHPTVPATAFWAVITAIATKKNPLAEGAKKGLDNAAVELIVEWAKKYMFFLPAAEMKG